jgi:hypothetical protein
VALAELEFELAAPSRKPAIWHEAIKHKAAAIIPIKKIFLNLRRTYKDVIALPTVTAQKITGCRIVLINYSPARSCFLIGNISAEEISNNGETLSAYGFN